MEVPYRTVHPPISGPSMTLYALYCTDTTPGMHCKYGTVLLHLITSPSFQLGSGQSWAMKYIVGYAVLQAGPCSSTEYHGNECSGYQPRYQLPAPQVPRSQSQFQTCYSVLCTMYYVRYSTVRIVHTCSTEQCVLTVVVNSPADSHPVVLICSFASWSDPGHRGPGPPAHLAFAAGLYSVRS